MTRWFLVPAVLLAAVTGASAAPVPKLPPPPAPKASANFTLSVAKVVGETVEMTVSVTTYQSKMIVQNVVQNGQNVVVQEVVTTPVQQTVTTRYALANLKATTADGKELDADALAKKLGDGGAVVQTPAGFDPEWRKLMADDVVFLEMTNTAVGGGRVNVMPGGIRALPAVPAIIPPPAVPPPPPIIK